LVREYASLTAQAHGDRRRVQKLIDSVAHPAKLRHTSSPDSAFLTRVHRLAETGAWAELKDTLHRAQGQDRLPEPLLRLLDSPSLHHLVRRAALCALAPVQRYQALRDQMGPPARSEDAVADGSASRQRGAAVEAAAARALQTIADRLNEAGQLGPPPAAEEPSFYKVVTSMRAPSTLPADHAHAKTEWDVVLLERASVKQLQPVDQRESAPAEMPQEDAEPHGEPPEAWDIRLLLEAKASVDAPATDLPRLLRGLQLLSQADPAENYVFQTREGPVTLRGATLSALPVEAGELDSVVLYCSDGPEQAAPRLLSAASRMQLLSAPASLAFAARG